MPATLSVKPEFQEKIETSSDTFALSPVEAAHLFDATARQYTGLSGEEFLRMWDADSFTDSEAKRRAMRVAILIPLVRKTSARKQTR